MQALILYTSLFENGRHNTPPGKRGNTHRKKTTQTLNAPNSSKAFLLAGAAAAAVVAFFAPFVSASGAAANNKHTAHVSAISILVCVDFPAL